MNCMTYSSSNSFSAINSVSMSVENSNFTPVFYKAFKETFQDLIDRFFNTFFQNFSKTAKDNVSLLRYKP